MVYQLKTYPEFLLEPLPYNLGLPEDGIDEYASINCQLIPLCQQSILFFYNIRSSYHSFNISTTLFFL